MYVPGPGVVARDVDALACSSLMKMANSLVLSHALPRSNSPPGAKEYDGEEPNASRSVTDDW